MSSVFAARRQRVLDAIQPGVLLIASTPVAVRNSSVLHPYRADSDLYYLSGFEEPDCVLALSSVREPKFVLFVREIEPARRPWDGSEIGVEGAKRYFFADEAYSIKQLDEKLPELLTNVHRIYYALGRRRSMDERVLGAIDRVKGKAKDKVWWPTEFIDPGRVLDEHRLRKTQEEREIIERAIAISAEGHLKAMAAARPGMMEYEIEALLFETFRRRGASRVAYDTIVASGSNATTLHYTRNDGQLKDGDLLLIDAGCEYGYYAADLTRTFPVNGRFSPAQRDVYAIVLASQAAAIAAIRPGTTLDAIHDVAVRVLAQGLLDLGVLAGSLDEVLEKKLFEPFYMHRTSHFLGLDVHDVGSYYVEGQSRRVEPGMVMTVEPGLYFGNDEKIPAAFRGIGVRIEDDVWVAEEHATVLSAALPKTIDDVEQACR